MFWKTRIPHALWNPWAELDEVRGRMNRLMADDAVAYSTTPIQLWANEDGLRLAALVPGVAQDDIDVSVEGSTLTMKVRVRDERAADEARWQRRERTSGSFTRTLRLPYAVDPERVSAKLENGRLDVELPRAESDKPRRITVSSN